MSAAAWLIGSITLPRQELTIVQGATSEFCNFDEGSYYLRSATATLSMLAEMVAAINLHTLVSGAAAVVRRDRLITISATQSFTLAWPADGVLRDLLGFTGALTPAATSFTATNISPLLWSPGYLATPKTIAGVTGYTVPHQAIRKSSDGTQVQCDHYGEETWQDLSWTHIMPERMRTAGTTAAQGGTFHQFFQQCAMLRRRFLYHQEIDEDDASSTSVTWDTAMGAYVLRPELDGDWYRRNVPFAEVSSPLDLPIHLVAEYA